MLFLVIILSLINLILTAHALWFVIIALTGFKKRKEFARVEERHSFCAVIAARNEEKVIADVIRSLKEQHYPADLLDIYVVLNNCTDDTGKIALSSGAKVYECQGEIKSKGDALYEFFGTGIAERYDAFCIFDADNVVDSDFILRMNDALSSGVDAAQGYRESRNPLDSRIAGCSSAYFWFVNKLIDEPRFNSGLSAIFAGTGFMMSAGFLKKTGFDPATIAEDLEMSIQGVLKGVKVAFVREAVTYDEQPNDWKSSWNQWKRWGTGMIQCLKRYGGALRKDFSGTRSRVTLDYILNILAVTMQPLIILSAVLSFIVDALAFRMGPMTWMLLLLQMLSGIVAATVAAAVIIKLSGHKVKDVGFRTVCTFWIYGLSIIFANSFCFIRPEKTWKPIRHTGGKHRKDA